MVSFTSRPLYLPGKRPWYPLHRRLGGLQSRSEHGYEEKKFPAPAGTRTPAHPDHGPELYHRYFEAVKMREEICTEIEQKYF
jgi:hypothetical protein